MTKKLERRFLGKWTVFQDSKGLYTGVRELRADPMTGDRRRKKVRRKNEDDLETEMRRLERLLILHGDVPESSTTVAVYMRHWIDDIDKSRPKTRAGYRSKIEQYIIPAIGKIKLDQLMPADVRRVEHHIVTLKGLSSTSALQAYQILAKALSSAEREGKITRNVARLVDPPVRAVVKSNVLDVEQATKVLGSIVTDRLGSRWATALLTGMRQGEALGLELDRVNLQTRVIDLSWQLQRVNWRHGCNGKCGRKRGTDCPVRLLDAPPNWEHRHLTGGLYLSRPKSRSGWREIPLVEPLVSILERRIAEAAAEPNPYGLMWTAEPKATTQGVLLPLDGSPLDPSRDNAAWHKVLEAAEVPDMRLHDARHTAVTFLYDLGVPEAIIQAIVGQSVIAVTRGYRHNNLEPLLKALEELGAKLSIES